MYLRLSCRRIFSWGGVAGYVTEWNTKRYDAIDVKNIQVEVETLPSFETNLKSLTPISNWRETGNLVRFVVYTSPKSGELRGPSIYRWYRRMVCKGGKIAGIHQANTPHSARSQLDFDIHDVVGRSLCLLTWRNACHQNTPRNITHR